MTHARRPTAPRTIALLAALSLPAALGACTDAGYPAPGPTSSKARTTGTPSATSAAAPTTTAPASAEAPQQAAEIAAKAMTAAVAAVAAPGPEGKAAREAAFTGSALAAANAQNALLGALTAAEKDNPVLSDADPAVLTVSQGPAYPRAILVKTTRRASGFPLVTLLVAADAQQGYRVAGWATLLPGATLTGFAELESGSVFLTSAAEVGPSIEGTLADYAASLAYPPPAAVEHGFVEDSYAATVRQAAKAQADALGSAGSVSQQHEPQGVLGAFRLPGEQGSVVLIRMDRKDVLQEKTANAFTPTKKFTALSGKTLIDTQATQQTVEYLLVRFPVTGKAVVLGAAEQLYAASGS